MDRGLFHVNEYFNLTVLEQYIEQHPEDADKWLVFLEKKDDKLLDFTKKRMRSPPSNTMVTPELDEDLECNLPADYENVCIKCKRTWASTPEHFTTTLLCGHKYHTACWCLHTYEDTDNCIFEGCGQSTYGYIRDLSRRRERMRVDTVSVLTEALSSKRGFKFDIMKMKRQIRNCTITFKKFKEKEKLERNIMMKKHIFSIRQIQSDMNNAIKGLSKSAERKVCFKEIQAYRRIEREIFRKYHLSLRDLLRKKIIKNMDWRVRSMLERHARINSWGYRFGIRIYPGSKKWTLPESEEGSDSESDSESDSDHDVLIREVENLPGTE
jgi:hypothetical protein